MGRSPTGPDAMTSAEFEISRDRLGYSASYISSQLNVGHRTVAGWSTERPPSRAAATWIRAQTARHLRRVTETTEAMIDLHAAGLPVELVRYTSPERTLRLTGCARPQHYDAVLRDVALQLLLRGVHHTIVTDITD